MKYKEDCIFYNFDDTALHEVNYKHECKALNKIACEKCSFYKSVNEWYRVKTDYCDNNGKMIYEWRHKNV